MLLTRRAEFSASHSCYNPKLTEQQNLELYGEPAGSHGHGHNYTIEVTLEGDPDPVTGMVVDLGLLERSMEEIRKALDHKFLNKIEALGMPTLENISRYIFERVQHAGKITRVSVHRDSCNESCTYFGPQG